MQKKWSILSDYPFHKFLYLHPSLVLRFTIQHNNDKIFIWSSQTGSRRVRDACLDAIESILQKLVGILVSAILRSPYDLP